jgi:hypothetical protein
VRYAQIAIGLEADDRFDAFVGSDGPRGARPKPIESPAGTTVVSRSIATWPLSPDPGKLLLSVHCYALPEVGRADEARSIADEALAAARASDHPLAVSYTLHGYGRAFVETDPERALIAMRQAIVLAREPGLGFFEALYARDLVSIEGAYGDPDEGLRLFDVAIEAFHRAGNAGSLGLTLANLTMYLDDIGQPSVAATLHGASTGYPGINTLPKLPSTVEHLRVVLGETEFTKYVAAGGDMKPVEAVRYARQQIAILRDPVASA